MCEGISNCSHSYHQSLSNWVLQGEGKHFLIKLLQTLNSIHSAQNVCIAKLIPLHPALMSFPVATVNNHIIIVVLFTFYPFLASESEVAMFRIHFLPLWSRRDCQCINIHIIDLSVTRVKIYWHHYAWHGTVIQLYWIEPLERGKALVSTYPLGRFFLHIFIYGKILFIPAPIPPHYHIPPGHIFHIIFADTSSGS